MGMALNAAAQGEVIYIDPDAKPTDLFEAFKQEETWQLDQTAFTNRMKNCGFRFLDAKKSAATTTLRQLINFMGNPVYEARVFFADGKLRRAEMSLFNKGDADRQLTEEALAKLIKQLREGLDTALEQKGMDGKTVKPRPNYAQSRVQWTRANPGVQLEWAYVEAHRSNGRNVPYSAEFVKVLMVPLTGSSVQNKAILTGEGIMAKAKTLAQLRKSVQKDENGDVWIDGIPMVDQGQKGYCAAASSERLLRYYGIEVDEHQIAQLANTSAEGGTSLSGMALAISKVGRHYQLDVKSLISVDDGKDFLKSDTMKQIEQYNMLAKKSGKPTVDWRQGYGSVMEIYEAMDKEVLLQSRMRQKQQFATFQRNIKQYVDAGIPILWACFVGMYPEDPELGQQGAFGHMRMIIGYNAKEQEIIYSDTWGAKHEKKRMPENQAWAMTKGLMVMRPRM